MDAARTDTPASVAETVAEVAALVDEFRTNLHARIARVAEQGSNRELVDAVQIIEKAARTVEQASVAVTAAVDRRGVYLDDGHRDVKAWLRASVQCSPTDATRRWRLGRLGRACPQVGAALAAGTLGVTQASKISAVWSNPRVRHLLEDRVEEVLAEARQASYSEFEQGLDEWARLADQDGGHRDRDAAHAARNVRFVDVGDECLLRGQFYGLQAEVLQQIFTAFVECEYRLDVDEARARLGVEHPKISDLARTPGQRRADAFAKLFDAAATAGLDGRAVRVTVDIVIDQHTFEQQLLDVFDPLHLHREPQPESCGFDADYVVGDGVPPDPVKTLCRTVRGTPVDPADAVIAALTGHVRRVIVGGDGVVIDLGRRGRLFSGSSREAAFLQAAVDGQSRCLWPGCDRVPRQIDHSLPHGEGGPTCPSNAGGMCGHHNLIKNRGYQTRRGADGRWHTYRPDGTEITAA